MKRVFSAALLSVIVLTGCKSAGIPGNCRVTMKLKATARVNMDRDGKALPVPVRFYQLQGVENLKEAGFEDIWSRAGETLGDDLVTVNEVVVYPAQKHAETLQIQKDTVFLAAAAIFRQPEGITWRTFTKLPPWGTLERCTIEEPGGPYYFLLDHYTLRGSNEPISLGRSRKTKKDSKGEPADEGADTKKKRKKKRRK